MPLHLDIRERSDSGQPITATKPDSIHAQIYRDIALTFGKDDGADKAKKANLNVYLLVTNVFNTQMITGVYRATGSPDDDGYLAAAQYQQNINGQNSPQSFRDLYALKVDNPYNFGAPRTIRLGVRFDF